MAADRLMAAEIEQLTRLVLAWAWLVAWIRLAPALGCAGVLVLMAPAVMVLAWNMLEPALLRRRAFVAHYLRPEGWLWRLLSRRLLLSLWQILKAMVLVAVILVAALQWSGWMLLLLAGDLLLALLLYRLLLRFLERQARTEVAGILARRLLVRVNFLLLIPAVTLGQLLTGHTDYRPLGWSGTLDLALSQVKVGCDLLAPWVRAGAGQEAIAWRLMQLGMEGISNQYLALAAWFLFLLTSTLALWGWSRLLAGALIDRLGLAFLAGKPGNG